MRYLICFGPGIGDFIFILPMVKTIRMNDPEAIIDLFTRSTKSRIKITEQLATLTPNIGINKISYYALDEPFHTSKFALSLLFNKKYDYGFVISYENSPNSSIWPYVIVKMSCKKTIGSRLDYKPIVKYDIAIPIVAQDLPRVYIIDYERKMLQAIGMDTSLKAENENFLDIELLKKLLPSLKLDFPNKNSPVVSLLIGAASFMTKNWPYEYYSELIDLLSEKKINIIILGGV